MSLSSHPFSATKIALQCDDNSIVQETRDRRSSLEKNDNSRDLRALAYLQRMIYVNVISTQLNVSEGMIVFTQMHSRSLGMHAYGRSGIGYGYEEAFNARSWLTQHGDY